MVLTTTGSHVSWAVDHESAQLFAHFSPGFTWESTLIADKGSYFAREITVDDLIQMNIAEIRTRIHHLLQRPVLLAHTMKEFESDVLRILNPLLRDETQHIAYSARLIEEFCLKHGEEEVNELMLKRIIDFNEITDNEVSGLIFEA